VIFFLYEISVFLYGVVGNIQRSHRCAPGSIPGGGTFPLFFNEHTRSYGNGIFQFSCNRFWRSAHRLANIQNSERSDLPIYLWQTNMEFKKEEGEERGGRKEKRRIE
jgi:hypothetical protein